MYPLSLRNSVDAADGALPPGAKGVNGAHHLQGVTTAQNDADVVGQLLLVQGPTGCHVDGYGVGVGAIPQGGRGGVRRCR